MKITGPENLSQTIPGNSPSAKPPDRAANFSDMLRETLNQSGSSGAAQKTSSLSEPKAVQNLSQSSFGSASFTDRASRVIDLLDSYTSALSNPHQTLREIEPQLMTFVNETHSLYEAYLESDRGDPVLKSIMEDLLRTAKLEGIRFQRGDYLDRD